MPRGSRTHTGQPSSGSFCFLAVKIAVAGVTQPCFVHPAAPTKHAVVEPSGVADLSTILERNQQLRTENSLGVVPLHSQSVHASLRRFGTGFGLIVEHSHRPLRRPYLAYKFHVRLGGDFVVGQYIETGQMAFDESP